MRKVWKSLILDVSSTWQCLLFNVSPKSSFCRYAPMTHFNYLHILIFFIISPTLANSKQRFNLQWVIIAEMFPGSHHCIFYIFFEHHIHYNFAWKHLIDNHMLRKGNFIYLSSANLHLNIYLLHKHWKSYAFAIRQMITVSRQ